MKKILLVILFLCWQNLYAQEIPYLQYGKYKIIIPTGQAMIDLLYYPLDKIDKMLTSYNYASTVQTDGATYVCSASNTNYQFIGISPAKKMVVLTCSDNDLSINTDFKKRMQQHYLGMNHEGIYRGYVYQFIDGAFTYNFILKNEYHDDVTETTIIMNLIKSK